ncbi:helix-turn-helix domain-containing protein [Pseudoroseomonas wenyumeiae]|uniref:AraC family transcriptional regulator n=1 Tax=Teichococcus wenyumeiae TaxID=2478470 RepID=A0A3A9JD12_9PROT|nr:helix-turn-helix transcriptional regulator [Pseudoroseomonas wenyumeiae]RKK04402.1 AraC family transcriptional regulator [Pseudoroseomonas wenyumeiae]RMI19322.1 helix-turn-helix domain-containing protein [Pseudoroseomonas wenyumeiae]
MIWETITAPPDAAPPRPMTVRAQSIPARHFFPEHAHRWNQVAYAISGVLTVAVEGRSFAISPEQAVWLPTGQTHRVGSLLGAEFRSLWIADEAGAGLPGSPTVFSVSPLLQALIIEAAAIEGQEDRDGYAGRVTDLILDQLRRAKPLPGALPWPRGGALAEVCEALYANPADPRGSEEWGQELAMSARTLARRFEAELGMSLRSWRRRLRLFKAIELLGGGLGVTQTAMELGYGSTSAFIYAFRTDMGCSPQVHMRGRGADRAAAAASRG